MLGSLLSLIASALTLSLAHAHSGPHFPAHLPAQAAPAPPTLNLTTLTSSKGLSVFECWQLQPGFASSSQKGTVGAEIMQLGGLANASYSIIPANFSAGLHNAPNVQYVIFMSGVAHITFPSSNASAVIRGGTPASILLAVDTDTTGHITTYPSDEQTIALQIPTAGGIVPNHTVLHSGACKSSEQSI